MNPVTEAPSLSQYLTRWMQVRALALAATLSAAGLGAQAAVSPPPQDIQLSYTITLNGQYNEITNIITFNTYATGGTGSWFAASIPPGALGYAIVDPFLKSTDNQPLNALMLGLVKNLPNDAPGQEHMVMMVNTTAAQVSRNIAWGTLFRNTLEDELIAAMHVLTSGRPYEEIQPTVQKIYDFALGDAITGIPFPTVQTPLTTWFDLAVPAADQSIATSGFSVMAFSSGQELGTGVASVVYSTPVPEPRPAALLLAGLLALGYLARKRARV